MTATSTRIASSSKAPPTRSPRRTSTSAQTRSTGSRTRSSARSESRSTAGSDEEVDRYLGDVAHDELIGFDGDDPEFNPHGGRAPPTPPGDQDFWVAESGDSSEQALTWDAEFGRWTAVVMNADAARGLHVTPHAATKPAP